MAGRQGDITISALCHLWGFEASPGCEKCGAADGYLARYIQINGEARVRWVCGWCEGYGTRGDVPLRVLAKLGLDITDLPLRKDNRQERRDLPQCIVCGEDGTEQHHWAPRAIFIDWPWHLTVPMCVEHHREWHSRMREYGLRWPHEIEKFQATALDEEWYERTVLDPR